jgi:hypothetical protein
MTLYNLGNNGLDFKPGPRCQLDVRCSGIVCSVKDQKCANLKNGLIKSASHFDCSVTEMCAEMPWKHRANLH